MLHIRCASDADRDAIWKIFQEVIAAGDTYPIDPEIPRLDALKYWFKHGAHVCVAESENQSNGKVSGWDFTPPSRPAEEEQHSAPPKSRPTQFNFPAEARDAMMLASALDR